MYSVRNLMTGFGQEGAAKDYAVTIRCLNGITCVANPKGLAQDSIQAFFDRVLDIKLLSHRLLQHNVVSQSVNNT